MKKQFKRFSVFLLKLLLLLFIITVAWTTLYKFVNPPITPLMITRYFEQTGDQKSLKTQWKNYDEISSNMKMAVIAAEDQTFPFNNGFDLNSIEEAIDDRLEGGRLRGASTISQQTAKNVFLWPERSWTRKVLEAYFTVLIEQIWGKKRILEVYLNIIETGKGIYGVDQAAQVYFGRSAKNLDIVDSALIAATLPNPRLWSPAKPTDYLLEREKWIRGQINGLGGSSYLKNIE
ncbi:MAG: monofunctional biosynthetic peptidoglycan transglycosylase [Thermodesulfobacteriota bacterium]